MTEAHCEGSRVLCLNFEFEHAYSTLYCISPRQSTVMHYVHKYPAKADASRSQMYHTVYSTHAPSRASTLLITVLY